MSIEFEFMNTQGNLTERLVERYVQFVRRHRLATLLLLSLLSIFWAVQARTVEMYSQFTDLLPQ